MLGVPGRLEFVNVLFQTEQLSLKQSSSDVDGNPIFPRELFVAGN